MAELLLGQIGTRATLQMALGAAFGPVRLTVALADGTPVDLTGAGYTASLWRPGDPLNVLEQLEVAEADPEAGTVDVSLSATKISQLAALDQCKKDPLRLEWALYVALAVGSPQRTHYGPVLVYLGAQP
jgi:hypothetical protein